MLKVKKESNYPDNIKDIIHDYIKENLAIDIEEESSHGFLDKINRITVKLYLDGKVISESAISI